MSQENHAAAQAAVSQQTAPCTREGFEAFFRESYRELVKTAMTAGATREEAEDSVSEALVPMYKRWPVNGFPLRYARKAVVYNFVKYKTRRGRYLTERGLAEHDEPGTEDPSLGILESREWVADVLSELPLAQREVMGLIADGLTYEEIAKELGKSRDVIRRRVCDARARLVQILNPDSGSAQTPASATGVPLGRRSRDG